jgi:hypothetical protein
MTGNSEHCQAGSGEPFRLDCIASKIKGRPVRELLSHSDNDLVHMMMYDAPMESRASLRWRDEAMEPRAIERSSETMAPERQAQRPAAVIGRIPRCQREGSQARTGNVNALEVLRRGHAVWGRMRSRGALGIKTPCRPYASGGGISTRAAWKLPTWRAYEQGGVSIAALLMARTAATRIALPRSPGASYLLLIWYIGLAVRCCQEEPPDRQTACRTPSR